MVAVYLHCQNQTWQQGLRNFTEFALIEHRARTRIFQDIFDLFGGVAVIDIHVGQASFEGRCRNLDIFGNIPSEHSKPVTIFETAFQH